MPSTFFDMISPNGLAVFCDNLKTCKNSFWAYKKGGAGHPLQFAAP
jgi:hypothetical protein